MLDKMMAALGIDPAQIQNQVASFMLAAKQTVEHFNRRFDALDEKLTAIDLELMEIKRHLPRGCGNSACSACADEVASKQIAADADA